MWFDVKENRDCDVFKLVNKCNCEQKWNEKESKIEKMSLRKTA